MESEQETGHGWSGDFAELDDLVPVPDKLLIDPALSEDLFKDKRDAFAAGYYLGAAREGKPGRTDVIRREDWPGEERLSTKVPPDS